MFNQKKKKKQEPKELKDPVNFTRIISIFFLVLLMYFTLAIFLTLDYILSIQDFVLIMLPILGFMCILFYLVDKDERIKMNNEEVQKEIDRIKNLYDTRKGAEKQFDSTG